MPGAEVLGSAGSAGSGLVMSAPSAKLEGWPLRLQHSSRIVAQPETMRAGEKSETNGCQNKSMHEFATYSQFVQSKWAAGSGI